MSKMDHAWGTTDVEVVPNSRGKGASSHPAHGDHDRSEFSATQVVVAHLWDTSFGKSWKGRQGLTDWSAYKILLRVAWHHGELIPAGVKVSLSVRQWAELAAISDSTLNAMYKRLRLERRLIRRENWGEGPKAGSFVLLVEARSVEAIVQQLLNRGGV